MRRKKCLTRPETMKNGEGGKKRFLAEIRKYFLEKLKKYSCKIVIFIFCIILFIYSFIFKFSNYRDAIENG